MREAVNQKIGGDNFRFDIIPRHLIDIYPLSWTNWVSGVNIINDISGGKLLYNMWNSYGNGESLDITRFLISPQMTQDSRSGWERH